MPSGPARHLINSVSECHHPVFPTHAVITFRNKLALLSNLLPYASYTIQIQMLITSHRMYFWGLSLLLGFHIWSNTYKVHDINSQSAYERLNSCNCHMMTQAGLRFHLEVSTMENYSSSQRETSERQCGEVFLEHDYKAMVATGEGWVTMSGLSCKIQRFEFIPLHPTDSNN